MTIFWGVFPYNFLFLSFISGIPVISKDALKKDLNTLYCYQQNTDTKYFIEYKAHIIISLDDKGEAKTVDFDAVTKAKMNSDPKYRVFAERLKDSVLNPACSRP
ncbi:unnamed protein product [Commensalibacter communis]|uniref:hypothetical protein n=1 Tax=Commensalibacter communis TaxID=2972786 RepID=UPI0022FF7A2E|nr:hypothetical protein [Commensalibacter communis]CAI3928154.1 unnamed protein product [Commensalibacter communis]CAI3931049.1 unnamed protein product [Commensalibacter communis]